MRQIESLIGNRYGFLVVKEYSYGKSGKHYWLCLCEHCHLSFHQRYGKLDNNKRQLNSFMKLKI